MCIIDYRSHSRGQKSFFSTAEKLEGGVERYGLSRLLPSANRLRGFWEVKQEQKEEAENLDGEAEKKSCEGCGYFAEQRVQN